ncbi:FtsK/SpoIIIE domain-containing protein (plasmid) [Streptomyces xanthophaeus]|uniref:FtsK/SpoIIIE domain-containing protein n=1 Tax=Streptomyces xanthophaeus TaxID=67385 RepID=UPI002F914382|nr:FtsK/SpoIIIE domain-containing protein [Streptomyces xanthophaeus]WST27647.1 FtsK/SpoIIIE domain-containing protein [Streptomyces xanthophaeus]WST65985.1 FtsK/SpoIIIE domain-containing protein [Streptomyces xanthophaeus]WST66013.1 FtsK/SpoIIIE domain-containing protein [Streptomyces xanthophaeus]
MSHTPTTPVPDPQVATVTYLPTARPATAAAAPGAAPALGGFTPAPTELDLVEAAKRILAEHLGTDTVVASEVMKTPVDLDAFDPERPLIPAWARSAEGWAAYSGQRYRASQRAFRRWVRRQGTVNGHVAQFGRGRVRMHDWVVGFEGIQTEAAAHQAVIATRDARAAARAARWTPAIMRKKKEAALQAMDRSMTMATQAVAAHKKAKDYRRKMRAMRAGAVYGPPVTALVTGYATTGLLGLTGAALATFGGGAFAGRHKLETETDWSQEWRSLGDGDTMSAPMLDSVFQAAKVIGAEETLRVVQMPMLDTRGAWSAIVDLPPGIPAKRALRAQEEIASAFGVEAAQVTLSKGKRAGRIELYVTRDMPFTEKAGAGPLMALEAAANFWGRISIGPDVRGLAISISVVERSGLIGGEPGAGKSASGNTILLAAALDPRVILWLADGKGGGDLDPFKELCEEYEGDADPEAFYEMLQAALADMKARYALLKKLGKRKVTEALADKYPLLRQKLLWVDELMFYTTDEEWGKKITKALRNLVSRGRAAGIVTFCATQKPGSDVVDTSLRDLLSIRWALRCTTPEASDTILGKGAAAAGYSAKTVESEMRGAGFLWAEGSNPVMVRADYYDDDQVTELLARAYDLRAKAGTLPEGEKSFGTLLREKGEPDAEILAVLADTFDAYEQAAKAQAEAEGKSAEAVENTTLDWLPGSVLIDALTAAGLTITAEKLGALVARTDEEKKKRAWPGSSSNIAGYTFEAVTRVAKAKYGLTA